MRLVLSALLALVCAACSAPSAPPAEADGPGPALWRIADADSQIWLLGSVHLLPPDLVWRSAEIDDAFGRASELIVETDTSTEGEAVIAAMVDEHGRLRSDRLPALLDATSRARLARICASYSFECARFETMRPWLASISLSVMVAVREGHTESAGVESVLLREARARGMTISILETPDQHMRVLTELSRADEVQLLVATLRQIDEEPEALDLLDRAWARGDTKGLHALLNAQIEEAGDGVAAALIDDRNRAWADIIETRLAGEGDIFIAVGAAHMLGDAGLITLLRARGIAVEGP